MQASLSWLRELCPLTEPVERIEQALTARGLTVDSTRELGEDHVLEIDVPANRPDCLGHVGLARELAAAFSATYSDGVESVSVGPPAEDLPPVTIEAPAACPRYSASIVRQVQVGPSPRWVAERLEACGLRSISNVVDISNLVLLQLGQPIHFFDLSLLEGPEIRVRLASEDEILCTLDGVERRLDGRDLVIADARRAIALAGVIGGAATEIRASTREVLIEAATFDPTTIRRTSRRLGIRTDASHRFERGVDPNAVLPAQALASQFLASLASGQAVPGVVDVHPAPRAAPSLELRDSEVQRLLGYRPEAAEIDACLAALELTPRRVDAGTVGVTIPPWRIDLEREADLVEEVARHLGYERVPVATYDTPPADAAAIVRSTGESVRDLLAGDGFHEAVGYAMIAEGEDAPFVWPKIADAVRLTNPIADWLAVLRRSVLPGLLRATDLNLRRGVRSVRLFEIGHVFQASDRGSAPAEPVHLGLAWCGPAEPEHWSRPLRAVDLYDVLGQVERVIAGMRPGLWPFRSREIPPGFHPGMSTSWTCDGAPLAWCGALHPDLQRELGETVFLAEVDLTLLAAQPSGRATYRAVPKLTPVTRDLALVLSEKTPWDEVRTVLLDVKAPAPVRIRPVDRYEGPPLAPGSASLTVRLELRPSERTLTDEEIDGYREKLIGELTDRLELEIRT